MNSLLEHPIQCPYCGETITVLIDCSEEDAQYIEDCQVCCRPIGFHVYMDIEGEPVISVSHEND